MPQDNSHSLSRRRFLRTAGATALAVGTGHAVIIPGRAKSRTLRILRDLSFIPEVVKWDDEFNRAWGEANDTQVIVDTARQSEIDQLVATEAKTQRGHDLVTAYDAGVHEDQAIDHRDIYEECERRYGKPHEMMLRNVYNPQTGKYFAFGPSFNAYPANYRKDLWDSVGQFLDTWDDIRRGGRHIKLLHTRAVGISMNSQPGNNLDSNFSWRAVLYSFGGSVQNIAAQPVLKSAETLEALKFAKALFEEAMSEDVMTWDNTSNNRALLADEISYTLNPIPITRAGENKKLPIADKICLAKTPQGPASRLIPTGGGGFIIWKFAKNIEAAKKYLIDRTGRSRGRFLAGGFFNMPTFPGAVPDLILLLANDSSATPPDKYQVLSDAGEWHTNYGHPGYSNPAISEVSKIGLIPAMFASAATGKMTPDEALTQADQEVRKIYDKWRTLGKV